MHATADSLEQAIDDLHTDWGAQRHQRWISDTPAQPGNHAEPATAHPSLERLPVVPSEVTALDPVERLRVLIDDSHDLHAGTGRWTHTPAGAAARERNRARTQLEGAQRTAQNPSLRRRERRAAAKTIDTLAASLDQADRGWQQLGEPIAVQLHEQITTTRDDVERRHLAEAQQRLNRYLRSSLPEPSIDPGRDLGIGL